MSAVTPPPGVERVLREFFNRNRHEELTLSDAVIKVGRAHGTVRNVLDKLVGDGILERVSIYRLKEIKVDSEC